MPIATVDPAEYLRVELKTAPPDPSNPDDEQGYVMIRPLPYGMKLQRQDIATKMLMRTKSPERHKGRMTGNAAQDAVMEFETAHEATQAFDFAYCIGDHNLTDKKNKRLDFTKRLALKTLNPKIGTEIEMAINDLNEGEDEESLEDFLRRSESLPQDEQMLVEDSGENEVTVPNIMSHAKK